MWKEFAASLGTNERIPGGTGGGGGGNEGSYCCLGEGRKEGRRGLCVSIRTQIDSLFCLFLFPSRRVRMSSRRPNHELMLRTCVRAHEGQKGTTLWSSCARKHVRVFLLSLDRKIGLAVSRTQASPLERGWTYCVVWQTEDQTLGPMC